MKALQPDEPLHSSCWGPSPSWAPRTLGTPGAVWSGSEKRKSGCTRSFPTKSGCENEYFLYFLRHFKMNLGFYLSVEWVCQNWMWLAGPLQQTKLASKNGWSSGPAKYGWLGLWPNQKWLPKWKKWLHTCVQRFSDPEHVHQFISLIKQHAFVS